MENIILEPLKELTDFMAKGIPPKYTDKKDENTVLVLNQKCNRDFRINYSQARLHDESIKKIPQNKIIRKYDVLINSTGVGTAGRVCQIIDLSKKATVDGHMIILRNNQKIDPLYYGYAIKSHQKEIENLAEGSTGQTEINKNRLMEEILITYPKLKTDQKKISNFLYDIDSKIDLNNRINKNLEEQLRSLYISWFVNFEPFNSAELKFWKHGKLKDILKLKKQAIKAGDNLELPYLPIDVIPMHTFSINTVKPNSEAKSSLITFNKNDILIGAMRVYFHRVVIAPLDGITRNTCFVLSPYDESYLSFALLCCDQESTIEYAQSTSKGTTMPYAVWKNGLGDMEIEIPPKDVANKFDKIARPMLEKIQNSYFENKKLQDIRDNLLPKLMSGELDISNIDI